MTDHRFGTTLYADPIDSGIMVRVASPAGMRPPRMGFLVGTARNQLRPNAMTLFARCCQRHDLPPAVWADRILGQHGLPGQRHALAVALA